MKRIICFAVCFVCLSGVLAAHAVWGQPVEIIVGADRTMFVGGQNIVLKADIIFNQQATPFWEELAKLDFSPFKMEKFVLGERKMFEQKEDLSRDFRQVTFLLSLPVDSDCGDYTIPSFSLSYSYFDKEQNEIKGRTETGAISIVKVPILVDFEVEKDVVTIGEINTIRLTIWREKYIRILNYDLESAKDTADITKEDFRRWLKSLEVRGQTITDLNKLPFVKFRLLSSLKKKESGKNIQKEIFEYRFAFYEKPGIETPIPDFHLWYLNEKEKEQPKEITTVPHLILINSLLNPQRQSIEWLKKPKPYSRGNVYYFGYGPLVFGGGVLAVVVIFALVGIARGRRERSDVSIETSHAVPVYEIWDRLLELMKEPIANQDRAFLTGTRNRLAELAAGILEIPANVARAKTGSEFSAAFREKGFSEDLSRKIKDLFLFLDKSIQGSEKAYGSQIWSLVDEIGRESEITKFLRKRKKFLFF